MITQPRLSLPEIERRLCDVASVHLGIRRDKLSPSNSFLEDLGCDSIDMVELIIAVEDEFDVFLDNDRRNPVGKAIFTRQPFRISDLAEAVYIQHGSGAPKRRRFWSGKIIDPPRLSHLPFTQLSGRWDGKFGKREPLFERLTRDSVPSYRRRSDGMRCVKVPASLVEIGCDLAGSLSDEGPKHLVQLDAFLIDSEPISTTAYCRFLNSVGDVTGPILTEWFILETEDDRNEHALVVRNGSDWKPVPGTEEWPIILVSWFGANAYSLWANGRDWQNYRDEAGDKFGSFLPSEAQWEYAARGPHFQTYPWGEEPPSPERMQFGQHSRGIKYRVDTLPMAAVNVPLGLSPFGLHHMAGNVWQWCRDWYDADFYRRDESQSRNSVNLKSGRVRSERGGSWIGPAELCRSSYRRGRPPFARGRCLGFRCVSSVEDVK